MNDSPVPARRPSLCGFTIIELMISLSLMAVLVALAAPSFREAIMSIRITGHTNDLMSDLALARSESSKLNVPVVVCASDNGTSCTSASAWNKGWIVFADLDVSGGQNGKAEDALRKRGALKGDPTLTLNCAAGKGGADKSVTYKSTGMSTATLSKFTLCDVRTTTNAGRIITINQTGRAISARATCPIPVDCTK